MSGGFAGGLAQGITNGMQLGLQATQSERLAKADERDAEIHELRKDQYASEKEMRDRRNNALREIAAYHNQATGEGAAPAPAQAAAAPMQTSMPQAGLAASLPDRKSTRL